MPGFGRGGLPRSLVVATVGALVTIVVTLLVLGEPLVRLRVQARVEDALRDAALGAKAELVRGRDADEVADRVGARAGCRVTVVDARGTPIGDTGLDAERIGLAARWVRAEDVALARMDGVIAARVDDANHPRIVVLVDIGDGRVVQASRGFAALAATRTSLRELFLLGLAVALTIGGLFSYAFMRTTLAPARELEAVAQAIARGELRARARTERDGELGELGHAIDEMAEQIAGRIARLETQEARLSTVLDAMTECVFVTDARTRIVITNAAFDRLVGSSPLGKTAIEAIRSPELHRAVLAAQAGASSEVEFDRVGDDARVLYATLSPLVSGGVVAVLHDVTKLRMADRIRRDFVANASHELRTPLTAIRGFAETLRDGAANDPDTAKRFLDVILRHTLRLQRIVDDLVALSRAEAPDARLELGPVDVPVVIAEVVRGLASHADGRGQQVRVELPKALPNARANADALDQVLVNLVDNAIKYTPEGGTIVVSAQDQGTHVCVDVHNSGPGIPAQHLDRIFERFYRVDPGRSREVGGTGLGLSIVKHLVQRMAAEITVESTPSTGTRFRVRLPVARVASDEASFVPASVTSAHPGAILKSENSPV